MCPSSPFRLLATVSLLFSAVLAGPSAIQSSRSNVLDNGVTGLPEVDCMDDRVRLTFRTQKPFQGRIFVKGMVDKDQCVNSFSTNTESAVQFEMANGQCNMRRSRKVDRAFRCTCFYMEADKVVTSRFDVSMLPTTDLIDTARMPLCTYSVRRDSVTGPVVAYATVGEPVFHVWQCESDMFSMLVHSCFVDDGNGQDRKPILDENGCSIDSSIVPELVYNQAANLAYSEVNVFKFADKVTTYFQCAVSTCMISEGMCVGKTPPRCGASASAQRVLRSVRDTNSTRHARVSHHGFETMDLAADKIVVLDLDEKSPQGEQDEDERLHEVLDTVSRSRERVCVGPYAVSVLTAVCVFCLLCSTLLVLFLVHRFRHSKP